MAKEGENWLLKISFCFPFHSQMLPGSLKREDTRKPVKTIFVLVVLLFAFNKQVWSSYCVPGTVLGVGSTVGTRSLSCCVIAGCRGPSLSISPAGPAEPLRIGWSLDVQGGNNELREVGSEVLNRQPCPNSLCLMPTVPSLHTLPCFSSLSVPGPEPTSCDPETFWSSLR